MKNLVTAIALLAIIFCVGCGSKKATPTAGGEINKIKQTENDQS